MNPRILEIRKGVLEKNDVLAASLRERFRKAGVLVLNIVSSPGSGKTALLEVTLARLLAQGYRAAALVGDLATDNDAARLARSGASVRQITTSGNCHLEAHMIGDHLRDWALEVEGLDFLFIENVGREKGEAARTRWLSPRLKRSTSAEVMRTTRTAERPWVTL